MARYAISPEGASQLEKLSVCLLKCVFEILDQSSNLIKQITFLDQTLGVYSNEIYEIVQANLRLIKNNYDDITNICSNLNEQADEILQLYQVDICADNGATAPTTVKGRDISDSFCFNPALSIPPPLSKLQSNKNFSDFRKYVMKFNLM